VRVTAGSPRRREWRLVRDEERRLLAARSRTYAMCSSRSSIPAAGSASSRLPTPQSPPGWLANGQFLRDGGTGYGALRRLVAGVGGDCRMMADQLSGEIPCGRRFTRLEDSGRNGVPGDRPHPGGHLPTGWSPPPACTPDRMNFGNVALDVVKVVHVARTGRQSYRSATARTIVHSRQSAGMRP
jgi:hypothetical protein